MSKICAVATGPVSVWGPARSRRNWPIPESYTDPCLTFTAVVNLAEFTYSGNHLAILRRRREWFEQVSATMTAWVPSGHRPTVQDAETRIRAFTLRRSFPAPDAGESAAVDGKPEWLCPV
jgi:hypothetical protein